MPILIPQCDVKYSKVFFYDFTHVVTDLLLSDNMDETCQVPKTWHVLSMAPLKHSVGILTSKWLSRQTIVHHYA